MPRAFAAALLSCVLALGACTAPAPLRTAAAPPARPAAWGPPEALVAPSSFSGVHGLAVDRQGRLLAGTVVGNQLWQVDRSTGAARVLIDAPDGQSDDIAIGPRGELAWTNYLMGQVRLRENDGAPCACSPRTCPASTRSTSTAATASSTPRRSSSATRCGRSTWPARSRRA